MKTFPLYLQTASLIQENPFSTESITLTPSRGRGVWDLPEEKGTIHFLHGHYRVVLKYTDSDVIFPSIIKTHQTLLNNSCFLHPDVILEEGLVHALFSVKNAPATIPIGAEVGMLVPIVNY